jgi:tetratricopeptide (TPR) repeat protein
MVSESAQGHFRFLFAMGGPAGADILLLLILNGSFAFAVALSLAPQARAAEQGLQVVNVGRGSVFTAAGLLPGDELLTAESLRQGATPGERRLQTPFDLYVLETEEAPRADIRFRFRRAGRVFAVVPPRGEWRLDLQPIRAGSGWPAECWRLLSLARAHAARSEWPAAIEALRQAQAAAAEDPDGSVRRVLLLEEGRLLERSNRLVEAAARYQTAVDDAERRAPESLSFSLALYHAAELDRKKSRIDAAEVQIERVLALQRQLAPGSLLLARTLRAQGLVCVLRGRLDRARAAFDEALLIAERLAPTSLTTAAILASLGDVTWVRGDLEASESHLKRALMLFEAEGDENSDWISALYFQASVLSRRGESPKALELANRSLEMANRSLPGSLAVAGALMVMGNIMNHRRDTERAEDYYKKALSITEELAPGTLRHAILLQSLGMVAQKRGDFPGAEKHLAAALAILEECSPGSDPVARVYLNLGSLAARRGDLVRSKEHYRRSLELFQIHAPRSRTVADIASQVGDTSRQLGQLDEAESYMARAVELLPVMAADEASAYAILSRLAYLRWDQGRRREAVEIMGRVLDAFESRAERMGGGLEDRSRFLANRFDHYQVHIAWSHALGDEETAFHLLERGRGRALLDMLGQRDLLAASEIPAALVERRREINAKYDETLRELAKAQASRDDGQVQASQATLRELRAKSDALIVELRQAAPAAAAWRYPRPADAAAVRAILEPRTLLLSYWTGPDETLLFVLSSTGLAVHRIPVKEGDLRVEVDRFRQLIEQRKPDGSALAAQSQRLFDLLVGPADPAVAGADRVLICPDGPLHMLPWGALRRSQPGRASRWLVEWKPFAILPSATVYAELQRSRPAPGFAPWSKTLVAFGAPDYSGTELAALPGTHDEVKALEELFGDRPDQVQTYLGARATEENARAWASSARYVHFAGHALLDEASPLDSTLLLSVPKSPGAGVAKTAGSRPGRS